MRKIPVEKPTKYKDIPDGELVKLCLERDETAWREFVFRYSKLIHYIIRVRCGFRGEESNEIYQAVFERVLKSLAGIRDPNKVKPWLISLTWNVSIDHRRRAVNKYSWVSLDKCTIPDRAYEAEQVASVKEVLAQFQKAYNELGPEHQAILSEKYNSATVREISEKLNVPKGSIHYLHKKACVELSKVLKRFGFRYEDSLSALHNCLVPLSRNSVKNK